MHSAIPLCFVFRDMAPKAKAVGPMPGPAPVPAPVPAPIPAPVVEILLRYWWDNGFWVCGDCSGHDDVNLQWRQFYRQYRS